LNLLPTVLTNAFLGLIRYGGPKVSPKLNFGTQKGNIVSVTPAITVGPIIYINSHGPFKNPRNAFVRTVGNKFKGYDYLRQFNDEYNVDFGENDYRIFVILHEIGHVQKNIHGRGDILSDYNNSEQGRKNNQAIIDACFENRKNE
jgi:hypothetical protein